MAAPLALGATCARGPRAAQVRAAARAQRKRTPPAISLSFQREQWKSAVLSAPLAVVLSFKRLRPIRGEVCYLSASEVAPRSYFLLIVGLIPIWRKWLFSAVARADDQRLSDADCDYFNHGQDVKKPVLSPFDWFCCGKTIFKAHFLSRRWFRTRVDRSHVSQSLRRSWEKG